jgi:poly(hydroxyalkanoate) granule-associated protein
VSQLRDSAHEIWLAGLGAFTKAQQEGSKVFDALVLEGQAMQRKTQAAAGEKFSEASQKVSAMAEELGNRASGQWDKLEGIFEDRVARAMHRLGMPSARAVHTLEQRLVELEKRLKGKAAPAKKAAVAKKKAPARKAAARPAARKKA